MKRFAVFGMILLGLLLNTVFFQHPIFGVLFFGLFVISLGGVWAQIFRSLFSLKEAFVSFILGMGSTVLFLGMLVSPFVVWYRVSSWIFALVFLGFGIGSMWIKETVLKKAMPVPTDRGAQRFGWIPKSRFLLFCFFAISVLQVLILGLIRTDMVLLTPWEHIHPWYLYNFFVLGVLLCLLLVSKLSFSWKFSLILLFSVLLHGYLPLTHVHPWGGDVWRMVGVEQKLLSGEPQLPVLLGTGIKWGTLGPLPVPEALLIPHKYTYGQLWGLVTLLAHTLSVSVVSVHTWLMPLLWSVFLPAISFAIGRLVFKDQKYALLFSASMALPFALQAIGSITVAVSLGFLSFLLALWFFLQWVLSGDALHRRFALGFGVFLFFGYALFAVLFWFLVVAFFLFKRFGEKKWFWPGMCGVGVFVFPLLDTVLGFSRFVPSQFSFLGAIRKMGAHLSGYSFWKGRAEGEIADGNLLWNHTPPWALQEHLFSTIRFPVVILALVLLGCVGMALWSYHKQKKDRMWRLLFLLLCGVVGGYVIGWYVLSGERIFVRRLDSVLVWSVLLWVVLGVQQLPFDRLKFLKPTKRLVVFAGTVGLSAVFVFTATILYASGPDIRVVSQDEYVAAQFISPKLEREMPTCVLSDTWILLALEATTNSEVVGGGFPIDSNFGQKQRVELYNELLQFPDIRILPKIREVVDTEYCFVAIRKSTIDPRTETRIHAFLGNAIFQSGEVLVWKMYLKKL